MPSQKLPVLLPQFVHALKRVLRSSAIHTTDNNVMAVVVLFLRDTHLVRHELLTVLSLLSLFSFW